MPRTNPESFFEVATRHLFRHINDVAALCRNPLVRSFFDRADEGGDEAVLRKIHARILTEAAAICEAGVAAGSEARARRQHAIVAAMCAGESALNTIAQLGLSRRHYYRERHVICTRVGRALLEVPSKCVARFEVGDSERLLFARAATMQDQGCAGKAVSELEDAYSCLPEGAFRSAVRLELARALISAGLVARSAELLTDSRDLSGLDEQQRAGSITSGWLHDHHALTEALLAMETGHDTDAGRAIETLAECRVADQRADEEALDTFLTCGEWYCQTGRFSQGRSMLSHARELSRRLLHTSVRQQIAIALLAGHCAEKSTNGFSLEYHWYTEALALSVPNGSAKGTLNAIIGLIFHYVSIDRDDAAYALAEEGLAVAKATEGTRLLGGTAVQIINAMLGTRYWRAVNPLLFEIEDFAPHGSLFWGITKYEQGCFLARSGRYRCAQSAFERAYEVARNIKNRKFESIILRERAVALYRAGSVDESVELMRHAVELTERYGGARMLWNIYAVAARLLGDRRIVQLARQAKVLKSARADASPGVAGDGRNSQPQVHADHTPRLAGLRPRLTIGGRLRGAHHRFTPAEWSIKQISTGPQ